MAFRTVKTRIVEGERDKLNRVIDDAEIIDLWTTQPGDETLEVEFVVELEESERVVEALESAFGSEQDLRIVIEDIEATIPRPTPDHAEEPSDAERAEADGEPGPPISVEELYDDIAGGMAVDSTYTVMVLLSTVVAVVGLVRDDVAMVIAAMIIAPLLRPNISLALATTLADRKLAWRSLVVFGYGMGLSVVVAVGFGWLLDFDASVAQIALRTRFGLLELMMAAAAGAAGAMSYTTGEAAQVVGVMVAVALLTPLVAFGMLLGAGHWQDAAGAGLLTLANVVCLNLAGVVTFFVQRVRPRNAWETERAERATRTALAIWVGLLGVLVALLVFGGPLRRYP